MPAVKVEIRVQMDFFERLQIQAGFLFEGWLFNQITGYLRYHFPIADIFLQLNECVGETIVPAVHGQPQRSAKSKRNDNFGFET